MFTQAYSSVLACMCDVENQRFSDSLICRHGLLTPEQQITITFDHLALNMKECFQLTYSAVG